MPIVTYSIPTCRYCSKDASHTVDDTLLDGYCTFLCRARFIQTQVNRRDRYMGLYYNKNANGARDRQLGIDTGYNDDVETTILERPDPSPEHDTFGAKRKRLRQREMARMIKRGLRKYPNQEPYIQYLNQFGQTTTMRVPYILDVIQGIVAWYEEPNEFNDMRNAEYPVWALRSNAIQGANAKSCLEPEIAYFRIDEKGYRIPLTLVKHKDPSKAGFWQTWKKRVRYEADEIIAMKMWKLVYTFETTSWHPTHVAQFVDPITRAHLGGFILLGGRMV